MEIFINFVFLFQVVLIDLFLKFTHIVSLSISNQRNLCHTLCVPIFIDLLQISVIKTSHFYLYINLLRLASREHQI